MDILLINPGRIRQDYVTEHLGIASLKSYVISRGFIADTLDMSIEELSVPEGVEIIRKIAPRMIGISLLDDSREKGMTLIKAIRKAGFVGRVVVGGYFATFAAREILRDFIEIDFVVRGEGEVTLAELMRKVIGEEDIQYQDIAGLSFRRDGEIVENPARPLIRDLDILPPVDRKYAQQILARGSHLRIYGTRGCWGQCTFCDIVGFYRSSPGKVWRGRSVEKLVDEIEHLVRKFDADFFVFNDDQFLLKGKKAAIRAEAFEQELKRRSLKIKFELMCRADSISRPVFARLKNIGLQRVFLGLESFDEKHLRIYNKRVSVRQNLRAIITLYNLKIDVVASVILANAYTTLGDLLKQFLVLYEVKRRYFNSPNCRISVNNKLEVYRGSAVYNEYKTKKLLTRDDYLHGCDFRLKPATGLRLKLFEIEAKISRLLLRPGEVLAVLFKNLRWHLAHWYGWLIFDQQN